MVSRRRNQVGSIPRWLLLPAGFAAIFLIVPVMGILARVPWSKLIEVLASESARDALWLSLKTCILATFLAVLLGCPIAIIIARATGRWVKLARTLLTMPMVLPPVVAGIALMVTFGRFGLIGAPLSKFGIEVGFTTIAVVMAQVFVSMPFLVVSVEAATRTLDDGYERAAASLGAKPSLVFRRVMLPMIAPAIGSGAALAFARSLGEFGATLTFAGSLQGTTRTLPLEIYLARESDPDVALALSLVLFIVAGLIVGLTTLIDRRTPKPSIITEDDPGLILLPNTRPTPRNEPAPPIKVQASVTERGLSYDVEFAPGEITAIVGPNGSGKSTLLQLVSGELLPDKGSVTIGDTVVVNEEAYLPTFKRGVASLSQKPLLFPTMTVRGNVEFGVRALGGTAEEAVDRATKELEVVGCLDLADRMPWELSGGQAQKVALARALAVDPAVVLLDEPFVALDEQSVVGIRELMKVRLSGQTTLMITHEREDVAALADNIHSLSSSRMETHGKPTLEPQR